MERLKWGGIRERRIIPLPPIPGSTAAYPDLKKDKMK